jgi:hypothetical protein
LPTHWNVAHALGNWQWAAKSCDEKVEQNMGQKKPEIPVPTLDPSELLRSARLLVLRASSAADLLNLVALLSIACEEARVTALRNVLGLAPRAGDHGPSKQNCGFANLFAALHHTRAEIKRRGIAPPKQTAVVYTMPRRPPFARRVRRGGASMA